MRGAIIGLGPQGNRVASALANVDGLELVAVVDRRDEALHAFSVPGATKLRSTEACWDLGIELVCIVTNGPSHAALALEAIDRGVKRIFVEKPMACSVSETRRMIDAAKAAGARLAVNQSRRHDRFYRWLRDQIRSGRFGEPRAAYVQRNGIGLGCLATHSFDLVRFLFDRDATRTTAWLDPFLGPNPRGADFVDPGGLVVMEMEKGCRAVVSQIEDGAGPMSVELDFTGARVRVCEKLDGIEIVTRDLTVKPGPNRPAVYETESPPPALSAKPDMTSMISGVLTELAGTGPMDCDATHGAAAVEILAAAHLSHRRGNVPVALPLREQEDLDLWLPVT